MRYSPSTGWFYDDDHPSIPADAKEIPEADRQALMAAHASGKEIKPDANGNPVAVDPPPPTDAELAAAVRTTRDGLIAACDWTVLPDTPLFAAQLTAWKAYRQALRDITAQPGFPAAINWPVAPA